MIIDEKIVILFLIGLTVLLWIVTNFVYLVNKKKGIISFILSLIFTFFAGYYLYLVFYVKPISQKEYTIPKEKTILEEKISPNEIFVLVEINGNIIKVGNGDEIEIKKNTAFIIKDIEGTDKKGIKVNLIGFIGNPRFNDGQDLGYKITYKKIMKKWEVEKDKFEVEIKKDDEKIGNFYIKFVD